MEGYKEDRIMRQVRKKMEEVTFRYQEARQVHNSGEIERRKLESIKEGDMEKARLCMEEGFDGVYGTLSKNPLRSSKNLAISAISVFCRAAIEGGLHWEQAYTTCDAFILVADELKDEDTLVSLVKQAFFFYAEEVHKHKKNVERNTYVEECKKIIYRSIHDKIEVRRIAEQLSISPDYLERLFKASEGMTIKEAIIREKVSVSKNMLVYSDYSCSEIAHYLGFSSQSHFGNVFRRETGMTPMQYRKQYRKILETGEKEKSDF